ncbi:phytanoyl-CoA dioxygenase family protein [Aliamphritea ceti]|uniref:phytanoyl-CoA dioxygenase family protein n=1 Tax=Aliamphritea ceti TaxID=1524258 RepID=UPI0021C33257|nr:phytanoyl-CoA dioxygenase family protein [Aliamphritea ceti]
MEIIQLDHAISDAERAELLFAGNLLVFRQRPAMQRMITYTRGLLAETLADLDPVTVQNYLERELFLENVGTVQTRFRTSEEAKLIFFDVLRECGVTTDHCYYDHFPLRVVPFDTTHRGAHRAAIGHHRDTWGSNIQSQQNWWAPIFSLEAERTIAFYPDYWDKPLANNTNSWSFTEYLATRKDTQPERGVAYPSAPSPAESVDESGVLKVVIQPGDVLAFASAHLHASVPNTTDAIRYSVEMRTIHQSDLSAGRVAPNVDNAGTGPMYRWFRHVENRQPLSVDD